MAFLKTIAAAVVLAGLSALPSVAAEARLLEQVGEGGVEQIVGTLEWSETLDSDGAPGIKAVATIDDAMIAAELTIFKNHDPALPATHLFTATFSPITGFKGEAVVQLAGIMMRKSDAMQGTPLPGAGATVLTNQFIFAPSGPAPSGATLSSSLWMDVALVFKTGQRALLALQIDETAQKILAEMAL
jgi:hypothetical protein